MREIIIKSDLHGDKVLLVDNEDYDKVKSIKWSVINTKATFYAKCRKKIGEKYVTLSVHRFIFDLIDSSIYVDHIDHNGLNCQKINLRLCTHSENIRNRTSYGSSKYLGVSYDKKKNKYRSVIKSEYLGIFENEIEAARAYDAKAIEYHGEFANLNFKTCA